MIRIYPKNADGYIIRQLTQWDCGITVFLEHDLITEAHEVHFANSASDTALVVEGTYEDGALSAKIPDSLLRAALPIRGYVYVEDEDKSQTIFTFRIGVKARPEPSDVVYSDDDDYISVNGTLTDISEQLETLIVATDEEVAEMLEEIYGSEDE